MKWFILMIPLFSLKNNLITSHGYRIYDNIIHLPHQGPYMLWHIGTALYATHVLVAACHSGRGYEHVNIKCRYLLANHVTHVRIYCFPCEHIDQKSDPCEYQMWPMILLYMYYIICYIETTAPQNSTTKRQRQLFKQYQLCIRIALFHSPT